MEPNYSNMSVVFNSLDFLSWDIPYELVLTNILRFLSISSILTLICTTKSGNARDKQTTFHEPTLLEIARNLNEIFDLSLRDSLCLFPPFEFTQ